MAKHIHFTVEGDKYERLVRIKDEHGLTWRGMVEHGAKNLEASDKE